MASPEVASIICQAIAVGKCFGNAAMLLAAGDKGCRHALPHAIIKSVPPRLNRTFDSATNVQIKCNEMDCIEVGPG
jgi:ATP-dependent Clp protease protease subunit